MTIGLIFPHQLFSPSPLLQQVDRVYLVEDSLFFQDHEFPLTWHVQKLVFHRATMQWYFDHVLVPEFGSDRAEYLEWSAEFTWTGFFQELAKADSNTRLTMFQPHDYILEQRLTQAAAAASLELETIVTPQFIFSRDQVNEYFKDKETYFQTNFYKYLRRQQKVLVTETGKPAGGSWTYDADNRRPLPAELDPPQPQQFPTDSYLTAATKYVSRFTTQGSAESLGWAITHSQAGQALDDFLDHRLADFGTYQDAITSRSSTVYHSLISAYLNVGLLTPDQVLDRVLAHAQDHQVPLNSLEGFIRQVLGWREFVRGVYQVAGSDQRTTNHFGHTRKLTAAWYDGSLGIPPVDDVIRKAQDSAYAHHIERLMIIGNLMLLCELDPDEVYRWFMELFIDAYDWVMVPNVYGMSQYADGGLMVTKPYVSSSNYILKMSDYPKGEWCQIWDSLYWRFIDKHQAEFAANPRMKLMVSLVKKKDPAELKQMVAAAEAFIQRVTK